jgi:hypothetical protein
VACDVLRRASEAEPSSSLRRILHRLTEERTFEIRLPEGRVFVRYRGRPDDLKFSVMLQAQTAGGWRTICLIDNTEGKGVAFGQQRHSAGYGAGGVGDAWRRHGSALLPT